MMLTSITPLLKTSTLNCLTVWHRSTYRYKLFPQSLQSEDPNDQQFARSFRRPRARTTTIPPTNFWSGMNRLKNKKTQFVHSFRWVRARTIMIPPTDGCSRLLLIVHRLHAGRIWNGAVKRAWLLHGSAGLEADPAQSQLLSGTVR